MSNTLILPDNISFEEIARYWTHVQQYQQSVIGYYKDHCEFLLIKCDYDEGGVDCFEIANFYPDSRELQVFYAKKYYWKGREEAFEAAADLLDYIKERSNGQN